MVNIYTIVEDIKLFLDDFPYVSLVWISRLSNMVAHECASWVFEVIRSGSGFVSELFV